MFSAEMKAEKVSTLLLFCTSSTVNMSKQCVLLVPPFLKYSAGPLLGPSLLQSAARASGHKCKVVDLNARYLQPKVSKRLSVGSFVGDHDKPTGPRSLTYVEQEFIKRWILPSLAHLDQNDVDLRRAASFGFLSHQSVREAAESLMESEFGQWMAKCLSDVDKPDVTGISLLHAGQVIPAATATLVARKLWPQTLVVWGGPHVSGLGKAALEQDLAERAFAADVFVTGHAEKSFVEILENADTLNRATKWTPVVLSGKSTVIAPSFDGLELYDTPLTLPAQSTLGCAYGRCAFCTYPSIEDTPKKLDLFTSVGTVVDTASLIDGTTVSLKDSLVSATRLSEIGGCIQGRVKWSACTKLSTRLSFKRLTRLCADGLATLEVGLETLLPETQRRIDKVQSEMLYESFVSDVANLPSDLSLVVNYMVGFPWEDEEAAKAKLDDAERILTSSLGRNRGRIELNEFALERLAVMAKFPEAYGIDSRTIRPWPWASVLEIKSKESL